MHNADWITVFRQFPVDLHPQLMLVLENRTEISIETLFRIEPTYLVVRGRMGGTTENGLIFLVPFDQLAAVYLYKGLKESEVDAIFGPPKSVSQLTSRSNLAPKAAPAPQPPQQAQPAPTPAPGPAPTPAAMPAFGRPPEATAVARNNLLERLRAARQAAMPPNGK